MNEDKFLLGEIKVIHRPEQKGPLSDYWIAIYQDNVAGGETKEEARQNLLNKLKQLH